MKTLKITKSDYNRILDHAKTGLPNESCGLIAGVKEDGCEIFSVRKIYPLINTDQSREHFSIDPREQLAAIKDMRANGLVPLGNFHSHPETPARPSAEDIRLARDPSASYLILSLAEPEPVLRAFHVENETATAEEILVV